MVAWRGSAYYASGLFGQLAIVFPDHDAVVAIFSALDTTKQLLPHIWKHFPSAFASVAQPIHADALPDRQSTLRVLPPLPGPMGQIPATLSNRKFALAPNDQGARLVAFEFTGQEVRYSLVDERGSHTITAGFDHWLEQNTTMTGARLHHEYEPDRLRVVAGARWANANTLEMTWQYVESAFRDVVRCSFESRTITIDRSVNVNSAERKLPTLRGDLF